MDIYTDEEALEALEEAKQFLADMSAEDREALDAESERIMDMVDEAEVNGGFITKLGKWRTVTEDTSHYPI